MVTDQAEIRCTVADFYEKLYTKDDSLDKNLQTEFLSKINRKLPAKLRNELDQNITKKELRNAAFTSRRDTSPGWCGLTYEFWSFFWFRVENMFYKMQNFFLNEFGRLSDTQRRSIITLLFKGGMAEDLGNWRPVSLLCTDYKIISKVIATRLKNVLGIVINEDQTCGIPGRCIFSNLHLVRDLIMYTNQKRMKGYIISIDQEKAFDRVDRQFLYDVFETMNFGPKFLQWVKALYKDSEACVLVNGYMTRFFNTSRGVRQGCSTSSEFYGAFEEPMVEDTRQNANIKGIPLPGTDKDAMASLYADDNTFCILTRTSLIQLFNTFERFEKATGAHVKPSKTKGLCLGGAKPLFVDNIHVNWVTGLNILGVTFFLDPQKTLDHNWSNVVEKLEDFLLKAKNRKLSLKGKTLNLNMAGLSQFWYLASVLPFPESYKKQVEDALFQYLWTPPHNTKKNSLASDDKRVNEPIERKTLYLPKDKGGIGLLDPITQSTALRSKFISHIVDPHSTEKWVFLARYWIGFPLGTLHPDWIFLRANHLPKIDRPIYPYYYLDCLDFFRHTTDITKVPWDTKGIRTEIADRSYHEPDAHKTWVQLGWVNSDWALTWPAVYSTYASGFHQDTHYLFLHCALYTNLFLSKFHYPNTNKYCDFCEARGKKRDENNFHLFFECKPADRLWKKVTPLLKLVLATHQLNRTKCLFNFFPPGRTNHVRKIALSILQIILHKIWLNRNEYKHNGVPSDPEISKKVIFNDIVHMVKARYNVYRRRNKLKRFKKLFCIQGFCDLDARGSLSMPFLHTT